ncbi:MAG: hypothetical protein K2J29_07710 [Muribaculaceae bacterium]|nr:hypothetical protein [Muribaculaceae bacterium]
MKKFFTLILLASGLAQASAYEPFIREDRVWEYVTESDYGGGHWAITHLMRFDSTVEVNGKLYHSFVNYSSARYPQGMIYPESAEPEENYSPSYYREEGEHVYVLTKDGRPVCAELDPVVEDDSFGEGLIFDFTLTQGEVTPDMVFSEGNELYTVSLPDVTVGGEPCRSYTFYDLAYTDAEEEHPAGNIPCYFTEGLGLCGDGILPVVNLLASTSEIHSFLGRVYSDEGDVLWQDPHYTGRENRIIYEDRIWEYVYTHNYSHGHLVRFRFEGTEVISGKEYHLLKPVLQIDYTDDGNYSDPHEVVPADWPVAYLREEAGKVYRIFPEGVSVEGPEGTVTEYGEMLIMDFNLREGENTSVLTGRYPETYTTSVFVAGETGVQQVDYELCRSVQCGALGELSEPFPNEECAIVGGVGPTAGCAGTLAALVSNFVMNMTPPRLNNVYDLEGNVIFAGLNQTGMLSGLSPVYASDNTSIVYDLTGRVVSCGENATEGLTPGIYVVRKDNSTSKTVIRQ